MLGKVLYFVRYRWFMILAGLVLLVVVVDAVEMVATQKEVLHGVTILMATIWGGIIGLVSNWLSVAMGPLRHRLEKTKKPLAVIASTLIGTSIVLVPPGVWILVFLTRLPQSVIKSPGPIFGFVIAWFFFGALMMDVALLKLVKG